MPSAQLLLLLCSLAFASVLGQPFPEGGENEEESHLGDIIQRAESIILRSIFKKVEDEDEDSNKELGASQLDWMSKRQHPGKRSLNDLEKRQHPGKREEDNEFDHDLELQKRQHPGRRSLWEQYLDIPSSQLAYLNELSKRQHPGKRYLAYSKRQHPGKRSWDDEVEEGELILERRQHPGKRNLASESLDYKVPCDPQDSLECSKSRLLLELLDNVSKGGIDEKQQQPGRRSPLDEEVEAEE
ncbi:Pro-thyrotropin-releasing hormone [Varanus komodoensis]|uniref:thyrotropin releasing hormone n=1 Tax=Varanus komodoensis TaxID=61221 RepID=UPI001CF7AC24|nr:thyrotropin releasing hormone [Varanus komodoensis]KAF7249721.1 Pro-thyrotropin-releasing hormone [Varanus komodoensis]